MKNTYAMIKKQERIKTTFSSSTKAAFSSKYKKIISVVLDSELLCVLYPHWLGAFICQWCHAQLVAIWMTAAAVLIAPLTKHFYCGSLFSLPLCQCDWWWNKYQPSGPNLITQLGTCELFNCPPSKYASPWMNCI